MKIGRYIRPFIYTIELDDTGWDFSRSQKRKKKIEKIWQIGKTYPRKQEMV